MLQQMNYMENSSKPVALASRVTSVDVYRGFVMLLMMAEVLNLSAVAKALPGSRFWQIIAFNQSHVEWTWLSLHDMIQPSFTFMVGLVLPYSIASRKSKGHTFKSLLLHTIKRSLILIFLGIFLRSIHAEQTNFTFEDTLTQIGLGYTFLVLLAFKSPRIQLLALLVLLLGYWLAFAVYPLPGPGFDYTAVGVPVDWPWLLDGYAGHWNKNSNLAWSFDTWFLNLFPRESPFLYNGGGYATLSFIPTLGTMVIGLLAGNLLKSGSRPDRNIRQFIVMGLGLIAVGALLHFTGVNPVVKRIWTPAWTLFSGGVCLLFLVFFYWVVDVSGKDHWSFFLKVIGMNSIAAYVIADGGIRDFINSSLHIHLGQQFDQVFGPTYQTVISGVLVLFLEWLLLYWMYTKKIFIKI
ncbi:Predicted acyltransferase [bacterium A37T11]|nr:Predicted acyltransferase [bacterium A37T11]